jgi:hypothetical protein
MGLGGMKYAWQRQTKDFAHTKGDQYSSLVTDNRGIGDSDKPKSRYSTSEMAKDIIEVVDHIGWTGTRELHVVGISMGGMIAQEIVSLSSYRRHQVKKDSMLQEMSFNGAGCCIFRSPTQIHPAHGCQRHQTPWRTSDTKHHPAIPTAHAASAPLHPTPACSSVLYVRLRAQGSSAQCYSWSDGHRDWCLGQKINTDSFLGHVDTRAHMHPFSSVNGFAAV